MTRSTAPVRSPRSTSRPRKEILAETERLAREDLAASYVDGDRNPPVFDPATNTAPVPASFKKSYDAFMKAEWWRLQLPEALGGQNAPASLNWAVGEFILGANAPDLDVRRRPELRLGRLPQR